MKRDFLAIESLTTDELLALLDRAAKMKADRRPSDVLAGRSIGMIFEKPSTRTRVSFEVGISELGGHAVVLSSTELQLGRGETIEDTARVLSRYLHALVVRTFEQDRLERLARWGSIPVINALSDLMHPCQALADLQTIHEHFGTLEGLSLTYVGDGNNVAHSLMTGCALVGMNITVATPPGYEPISQIVKRAEGIAAGTGARVSVTTDAAAAAEGADVLYTDVWASMGQEREAEERKLIFAPYQMNAVLVARAKPTAIAMHCLPAHRGEEITDDVIESAQSVVWDQAENRLHAQKALMEWLLA
ncbi:MAG TPA: ornithine carbamoyltransferase [Actinomycetota bacterium]|nr:ornithine carbamoyltransferase [Actinomycetota bacterium]